MDKASHLNSVVNLKNPHLKEMDNDILFHLGLSTQGDDLKGLFGDVKVNNTLNKLFCKLCAAHSFISLAGIFVMILHVYQISSLSHTEFFVI